MKHPSSKQGGLVLVLVLLVIFLLFLLLAFTWDRFFAASKNTITANQSMQHYQEIRGEMIYQLNRVVRTAYDPGGSDASDAIKLRGNPVTVLNPKSLASGEGTTLRIDLQRLHHDDTPPLEDGIRPVIYASCEGDLNTGVDTVGQDNRCHRLRLKGVATFDTLAGGAFMTQMMGFDVPNQ